MSFYFPDVGEIKAVHGATLRSEKFGNPTIASPETTAEFVHEAQQWCLPSKTANELMQFIEAAKQRIHIVGMRKGGYVCFDSDCPTQGQGTVYIDIDVALRTRRTGDLINAYVIFLHEVGHAKQWIQHPERFNLGDPIHGRQFGNTIAMAAKQFWMRKKNLNFSDAAKLLQHQELRMTKPLWTVHIEDENLAVHEYPICEEMGVPRRDKYEDLV